MYIYVILSVFGGIAEYKMSAGAHIEEGALTVSAIPDWNLVVKSGRDNECIVVMNSCGQ